MLLSAAAAFVPWLGVVSTMLEYESERQAELMRMRLEALADELAQQGYAPSEESLTLDDDLLHAFSLAARVTIGTRRSEKIQLFGRLLSNYALGREPMSCNKFEYMLRIIDELGFEEFVVLRLLRDAEIAAGRSHDSGPWTEPSWARFTHIASGKAGISAETLPGFLARVARTGLCAPVIGAYYDYTGGEYYTTPMLDELLVAVRQRTNGE
jgi:hypothetical protein